IVMFGWGEIATSPGLRRLEVTFLIEPSPPAGVTFYVGVGRVASVGEEIQCRDQEAGAEHYDHVACEAELYARSGGLCPGHVSPPLCANLHFSHVGAASA